LITHEEWKAIQSLESRHLRVQELFYVLKTEGDWLVREVSARAGASLFRHRRSFRS